MNLSELQKKTYLWDMDSVRWSALLSRSSLIMSKPASSKCTPMLSRNRMHVAFRLDSWGKSRDEGKSSSFLWDFSPSFNRLFKFFFASLKAVTNIEITNMLVVRNINKMFTVYTWRFCTQTVITVYYTLAYQAHNSFNKII